MRSTICLTDVPFLGLTLRFGQPGEWRRPFGRSLIGRQHLHLQGLRGAQAHPFPLFPLPLPRLPAVTHRPLQGQAGGGSLLGFLAFLASHALQASAAPFRPPLAGGASVSLMHSSIISLTFSGGWRGFAPWPPSACRPSRPWFLYHPTQ